MTREWEGEDGDILEVQANCGLIDMSVVWVSDTWLVRLTSTQARELASHLILLAARIDEESLG